MSLFSRLGNIDCINLNIFYTVSFRKMVMMNSIWICTFIIAFPINVAPKNVLNGILKCPQVIPARSNRGFGMEAHSNTVINPYFCSIWNIRTLSFSTKGLPLIDVVCSSFSISLIC